MALTALARRRRRAYAANLAKDRRRKRKRSGEHKSKFTMDFTKEFA